MVRRSQGQIIEEVIFLHFVMIVMKGIKEVVQVHHKEVFSLHPRLNLIQHHLKGILSKEVVKILIHLKEVLRII